MTEGQALPKSSIALSRISYALLACIIVFAYLDPPVQLANGFLLPSPLLIIAAPIAFWVVRYSIRGRDLLFVVGASALFLTTAIFAPNWADLGSRLFSVVQISFSLALFAAVTLLWRQATRKQVFTMATLLLSILSFGCIAETLLGLGELSNRFRDAVYVGGYAAYDNDLRDIALSGGIRPKFFASEPSIVAITALVLTTVAFATASTLFQRGVTLLLYTVLFVVVDSPVLLAALPVVVLCSVRSILPVATFFLVAGMITLSFGLLIAPQDDGQAGAMAERLEGLTASLDSFDEINGQSSERMRLVNPYISLRDALNVNPIFGLGVGGKRTLSEISSFSANFEVAFGNNAFATLFMYAGIVGSVCVAALFAWYWRGATNRYWRFVAVFAIFGQTMGGFESPRFWVFMALLSCVCFQFRDMSLGRE
ncbi:MAG: hypothetical protein RIS35_2383 [Pseudomonadota bacterium]|jgi:hypothetical protein